MALVLVLIVIVVGYGAGTGLVWTTRRCPTCRGARFARHRGWGHKHCRVVCPRCGGRGRLLRPAARAVRSAVAAHRKRVRA